MKIQYVSDLHLEFSIKYPHPFVNGLPETDADVIVLAGDVDVGLKSLYYAEDLASSHNKPVVFVPGNHEYYRHDLLLGSEFKDKSKDMDNVYVLLQGDSIEISPSVRIIGGTLWTNFKSGENHGIPQWEAINNARNINDFHLITCKNTNLTQQSLLTPEYMIHMYNNNLNAIKSKLEDTFKGKNIVVTHHGPTVKTQNPKFKFDSMAPFFINDISSDIIQMADVWIYGHTHSNVEYTEGKTKILSNQYGYAGMEVINDFDPEKVISV